MKKKRRQKKVVTKKPANPKNTAFKVFKISKEIYRKVCKLVDEVCK